MAETTVENIEENSLTMLDVLQEENQLEEDANAVLGASDDKNCTYSKGYIRQALYACKTCCANGERAGVCLACSFNCHENHELVELYTKRHFRCDCGNSKFGDKQCSLESAKDSDNPENSYNQNFDGVYCTCSRPYPDPENDVSDDMMQCVMCEDWYHSKHLQCEKDPPEDNNYGEMTCAECMKKHAFLWRYAPKHSVSHEVNDPDSKKRKLDVDTVPEGCTMPEDNDSVKNLKGGCFWVEGWRSALCACDKCKALYEEEKVSFLLDPKDSVQAYEEAGKVVRSESQYERGMKALASLDHVQQVTAIEEYNNMKDQLKDYLRKFAENKKVVREEDIKEFFSVISANKRAKVEVPPTFCR